MNEYFYHSILLTKEEAKKFYNLLKDVECPLSVPHCPFCFNYFACAEFRRIITALEKYLNEGEEE